MSEWGRVLSNKRLLFFFLLLSLLAAGWFFLDQIQNSQERSWDSVIEEAGEYRRALESVLGSPPEEWAILLEQLDSGEAVKEKLTEAIKHIEGYSAYLDDVQIRAKRQASFSLFESDKNGFSYRNILKTADDFQALFGTEVELGNDNGLERWLSFRGSDYCMMAFMLLLVMAFFDEQKKGLTPLIRSTVGGRSRLCLRRCRILALGAVLGVLLIYGTTLFMAFSIWGGADGLGRPIQSLVICKTCGVSLSISQSLMLLLAGRILSAWLFAMFLWFCLSFLKQVQLAWAVCGGILLLEYLLYTQIPIQSAVSIFKVLNLFSYIFLSDGLIRYQNINIFSMPVNLLIALLISGIILMVLLLGGILLVQTRRYPLGGRDILALPIKIWNVLGDRVKRLYTPLLFEIHKLVVMSGFLLILMIGLWLRGQLSFQTYAYTDMQDLLYDRYVQRIQGIITPGTDQWMDQVQESITHFEADATEHKLVLSRLREAVEEARSRGLQENREAWILDQTLLNNYFGVKSRSPHYVNALVSLILMVAMSASLLSLENKYEMSGLLRTCPGGKGRLLARKIIIVGLMACVVLLIVYSREWELVFGKNPHLWRVPVREIQAFSLFPLSISFGAFWILLILLRFMLLFAIGGIVLAVSRKCRSWESAFLCGSALLVFPSMLFLSGLPSFSLQYYLCGFGFMDWQGMPRSALVLGCFLACSAGMSIQAVRWWSMPNR